ncbi:MAG: GNAT family N-acetyltransferase [Chloroflexi bacterium]|nr:GNAT family N-acetyltransferase [Chloroflexota bacterium]MCL5274059.1 GNAT family N-acetyltransferase [Chloroflexota bacterium]
MNANAVIVGDTFTIRDASVFDIAGIWRLERICFPKDAYDIFTLFNLALAPNVMRLKAVVDDHLAGFLAGEVARYDRAGWIVTVGVSPQYQGRGIGRNLLSSAEQAMRGKASSMKLTVRRSNTRAIALYEHAGYRWISTLRAYYHDGEDGLIMEKDLTLL